MIRSVNRGGADSAEPIAAPTVQPTVKGRCSAGNPYSRRMSDFPKNCGRIRISKNFIIFLHVKILRNEHQRTNHLPICPPKKIRIYLTYLNIFRTKMFACLRLSVALFPLFSHHHLSRSSALPAAWTCRCAANRVSSPAHRASLDHGFASTPLCSAGGLWGLRALLGKPSSAVEAAPPTIDT